MDSKKMKRMTRSDGNVAFKCTYNDGGARKGDVGFAGTCSNANIVRNIEARRTWCSSDECDCQVFYRNGLAGPRPVKPCYESMLFEELAFGVGIYRRGSRDGNPISMRGARVGKVAMLTTRMPADDREASRIVFALYEIVELRSDDEVYGVIAAGRPETFLRLPANLAPKYWDYKSGPPDWRTGLFRFVGDTEVSAMLAAVVPKLDSPGQQTIAKHLLALCGARATSLVPPPTSEQDTDALEIQLKYSPGGEQDRHRRLKEYLAAHPESLGLGRATEASMEFRFRTGDRADLHVTYPGRTHAVVEVEVEGAEATLIGAHQVLKYRALLAGHLDESRRTVHGVLAAYRIPSSVRDFCERHGIRVVEVSERDVERAASGGRRTARHR